MTIEGTILEPLLYSVLVLVTLGMAGAYAFLAADMFQENSVFGFGAGLLVASMSLLLLVIAVVLGGEVWALVA